MMPFSRLPRERIGWLLTRVNQHNSSFAVREKSFLGQTINRSSQDILERHFATLWFQTEKPRVYLADPRKRPASCVASGRVIISPSALFVPHVTAVTDICSRPEWEVVV